MSIRKIICRTLLWLPLALLITGCSGTRYSHLKRGRVAVIDKDKDKVEVEVEDVVTTKGNEEEVVGIDDEIENYKDNRTVREKKKETGNPFPFKKKNTLPEDSIEIDVAKEIQLASQYGKIGFNLAIAALISGVIFLGLGFMVALIGLVYSSIAYYKISVYELPINEKERQRITLGLYINSILAISVFVVGGLIIAILLAF